MRFCKVRICGLLDTCVGRGNVSGPGSTLLPPGRRSTSTFVSLSVTVILEPGFSLKPFMHNFSRANCTSGTIDVGSTSSGMKRSRQRHDLFLFHHRRPLLPPQPRLEARHV